MKAVCLFALFIGFSVSVISQTVTKSVSLIHNTELKAIGVAYSEETYYGKESLKIVDQGGSSEAKFVKLSSLNFANGSIELELAGKPSASSSEQARGFVGIAFRINSDNSKFECFYIRPTNGRADDQVRRNHSVQYISFPDFPWYKLRKDSPEKYESYVDLVQGEWTKIRIEVRGEQARLFVHGNSQPCLIVNDLKHGPDVSGNIGLWIGPGTEAHFSDLKVETTN